MKKGLLIGINYVGTGNDLRDRQVIEQPAPLRLPAARISRTKYPVSRPDAALADPYDD